MGSNIWLKKICVSFTAVKKKAAGEKYSGFLPWQVLQYCWTAFIDNYLPANPALTVERISNIEVMRNYLTEEEIEKLKSTPIEDEIICKASLFAILTGLRFGAIQSLKWNHLEYSKQLDAFYLYFIDLKE